MPDNKYNNRSYSSYNNNSYNPKPSYGNSPNNNNRSQNNPHAQEPLIKDKEHSFVNPYTFIPISNKAPLRKAQETGKLSGVINCRLDIRTPTFIPNTTNSFEHPENKEHKRKVFYSYDDLSKEKILTDEIRMPKHPVIPGSEIRGMIRNVYEQLTNSCFLHVDEFNLPYKRTIEPKVLCIMKWNKVEQKWYIYPSVKRDLKTSNLIRGTSASDDFDYAHGILRFDGDKPYFEFGKWDPQDNISSIYEDANLFCEKHEGKAFSFFRIGDHDYYLKESDLGKMHLHIPKQFGNDASKINRFIIYSSDIDNNKEKYALDEDTISRFEHVIGQTPGVKGGYKNIDNYTFKYKHKLPIIVYADKESVRNGFYSTNTSSDNKRTPVYLSSSSITKEFFANTIDKILEKNNCHQPCKDKDSVCPACSLFGMVGDNGATAGKLRFADAEPSSFEYGKETLLEILSSPRISSTEFYLRQPKNGETKFWNYDYYTIYRSPYAERHSYEPILSGRKVYWNRSPQTKNADLSKMNCSITPLKSGTFNFSVYFDNVTEEELERLRFCLKLSENSFHKIGGGKPLGFGQVKLSVLSETLSSYKEEDGVIVKKNETYMGNNTLYSTIANSQEAVYIIKYSTDLPANIKSLIDYPRPMEFGEKAIFSWFANNRGSVRRPEIKEVLPRISDIPDNQILCKNSK